MTDYYMQAHWSQFAPGLSAVTHSSGCTWTTVANGIAAISGGRYRPTPDHIHSLVPRNEETNPTTPGWSIADACKAASRYAVTLTEHTGEGWAGVIAALDSGHYVVLQGDSDQFGNATCSGFFDGPHCIGLSPNLKVVATAHERWIDDPICPAGRWERELVLRNYAEKLYPAIRFGVFQQKVPQYVWRWQKEIPGLFMEFGGVNQGPPPTWRTRHQVNSGGTREYHCTSPESFRHNPPPGVPNAGSKDLVLLGELVSGGPGEYSGQWVGAVNAHRKLP